MTGRRLGAAPTILAMATGLAAALVVAVGVGAVTIPPERVLAALTGSGTPTDSAIILSLRLPRVLGAALVGAALAVAGTLLQGLLRNPLADPYVLGTSAGASVGAVIALLVSGPLGFFAIPVLAFGGALLAVLVVWGLARTAGATHVLTLLLAGVVLSSFAGSVVAALLVLSDRLQLRLATVLSWLMGGISVVSWAQLAVAAALATAALVVSFAIAPRLDAFAPGEDVAAGLGIDVERTKHLVLVSTALLTAAAVSIAGLVGFVGLVAPHAVRVLIGPRHVPLLPAAALGGALFLVVADLFARIVIAPSELPVGVISGIVGGPFFLALLWRHRAVYRL